MTLLPSPETLLIAIILLYAIVIMLKEAFYQEGIVKEVEQKHPSEHLVNAILIRKKPIRLVFASIGLTIILIQQLLS